jgi:signal transduction histidine kinase
MPPLWLVWAVFVFISTVVMAMTCTAIVILVLFQLRHDAQSRAFALMMFDLALFAIAGAVMQVFGRLGDDISGIFEVMTVAFSAMPLTMLLFAIEYLGPWTRGRRVVIGLALLHLAIVVVSVAFHAVVAGAHYLPDQTFEYTLAGPHASFLLIWGGLEYLYAFFIVITEFRKRRSGVSLQFFAGITVICLGALSYASLFSTRYSMGLNLFTLGSILLVEPVLRQRLFDPLARLNVELTQANAALALARQHAEDANKAKTRFLSWMNHELRTPLTIIINTSHMVLKGTGVYSDTSLPEAYRAGIATIEESGRELLSLISGVLDVSKIEAGAMDLVIASVDPVTLLRDAERTARRLVREGVEVQVTYPGVLPPVAVDEFRLKQVLTNLVTNACKFTERGRITLGAQVQDDQLVFMVADTGRGIPQQAQTRVFGEFAQATSEITREYGGTGLGLNIAWHLVRLHGGEIQVESVEGQGATFTFTVPLASAATPAPPTQNEGNERCVVIFPERRKVLPAQILVIGPTSNADAALCVALAGAGHEIITATSLKQGLKLVRAVALRGIVIVRCSAFLGKLRRSLDKDETLRQVPLVEYHGGAADAVVAQVSVGMQNANEGAGR